MTVKKLKKAVLSLCYVITVLAAIIFLGAPLANAGPLDEIRDGIIPQCDWAGDPSRNIPGETYGLGAFTLLAVNILKLVWGILGSLALVMFVWGGFLWLTARGEDQQVKQGWDTLINAVVGLVIVLGSWVIINTIILAFTSPGEWKVAQVFRNEAWHKLVEKDPVCIRAIIARKPGFVSPLPSGVAPGAAACSGTLPNNAQCRSDCECQSGECHNYGMNDKRCRGGGSVAGAPPSIADQQGVCCYVNSSGRKGARRKKGLDCETYLFENICSNNYNIEYQFWCPLVAGKQPEETCWEQSATNISTNNERSGNCRNAHGYSVRREDCSLPSSDPTQTGPL